MFARSLLTRILHLTPRLLPYQTKCRKPKCKKRLLFSFHWPKFRRFHNLVGRRLHEGRSVHLLRASYPESKPLCSHDNPEEGLRRPLRPPVFESVRVGFVADLGLSQAAWAVDRRERGLDRVARIQPDVKGLLASLSRHPAEISRVRTN